MIITQESLLLKNYLAGFQKSRLSFSFRRVLPPAITQLFTGIQRAASIVLIERCLHLAYRHKPQGHQH